MKKMLGFLFICLMKLNSYGFVEVTPNNVSGGKSFKPYYRDLDLTITNSNSLITIVTDEDTSSNNELYLAAETEYIFQLNRDITSSFSQEFETIAWSGADSIFDNWSSATPGVQVTYIDNPQDRMVRFRIEIPAGTKKGEKVSVFLQNYATILGNAGSSPSIHKPSGQRGVEIRKDLIRIPSISAPSTVIDFGQIDISLNSDILAFGGPISIRHVSSVAPFTATYSNEIELTNVDDNSKVPVEIALLEGSKNGPVLGNTFDIKKDTDIYVRATLPASSSYQKTLGTYTGNVTINLKMN